MLICELVIDFLQHTFNCITYSFITPFGCSGDVQDKVILILDKPDTLRDNTWDGTVNVCKIYIICKK